MATLALMGKRARMGRGVAPRVLPSCRSSSFPAVPSDRSGSTVPNAGSGDWGEALISIENAGNKGQFTSSLCNKKANIQDMGIYFLLWKILCRLILELRQDKPEQFHRPPATERTVLCPALKPRIESSQRPMNAAESPRRPVCLRGFPGPSEHSSPDLQARPEENCVSSPRRTKHE